MNNARFKIDIYDSLHCPFGLYHATRVGLFGSTRWKLLETFKERADALAFYEKIKDLPEYLP